MTEQNFNIVVGLDFSDAGELALREGLRVARDRGKVVLHVVHVVTEHDLASANGKERLEKQEAVLRTLPDKIWERIREVGSRMPEYLPAMKIFTHVRFGDAARTIVQVAADYDAAWILVGTHARHGIERFMLGSVVQELLRVAACPVLVVRPNELGSLPKTEHPEPAPKRPARPSQPRISHVYSSSQVVNWATHDSDTSGPTGIRMI